MVALKMKDRIIIVGSRLGRWEKTVIYNRT